MTGYLLELEFELRSKLLNVAKSMVKILKAFAKAKAQGTPDAILAKRFIKQIHEKEKKTNYHLRTISGS